MSAVQGSSVELPCNLTAPKFNDKVRLVLWFKNDSSLPIYTYDTRGDKRAYDEARHWSDDKVLSGRAFFRGDHDPGRLILDNVSGKDQGMYKCRVDFRQAPTRISEVHLNVIVPPEKPKIFTIEDNNEVRLKLGPYRIGDTVRLRCLSLGGRPLPKVTWWRDHALLDASDSSTSSFKTENELVLTDLKRDDLHSILTCQAANNNISVPVSTSVKLDMNFGPTEVKILNKQEPLSANKRYEVKCQTVGARPPPTVTWWMAGKQIRNLVTEHTSPDGNVTVSTLTFTPTTLEAGNQLVCRAGNPRLPDSTLEDAWRLEIHYVPSSTLTLGSSLNASNIKEGDDVYFECKVRASPQPYKITWRHNGRELSHNVQKGVILSHQSLVLQKVTRADTGVYTCTAHNSEGDGVSNSINLNIKFKPFCKPDQVKVYGVAKREKIHVSCEVVANPSADLHFEWVFNSSSERLDLQQNLIRVDGSRSLAEHTPQNEMDYGSLMCWATNSIGRMSDPCIFHMIPAGRPDPVHNCTVLNQTYSTLHVVCGKGFDGGLPQGFTMEVMDAKTHFVVANTTNTRSPSFTVTGLRPGTGYLVSVSSANAKGRSEPMRIHAFTTSAPVNQRKSSPGESALTTVGEFTVTPILAVLLVVGGALVLVFVVISAYFCVRNTSSHNRRRKGPKENNRISYTTTHIPMQKGIDDCIDDGNNPSAGVTVPMLDHEKNPDIIPIKRENEEDGGFGVYGEKTRYATLQRQRVCQDPCSNGVTAQRGYETMRNLRTSIPSLSQEVTYAELSLPRNKGYAPMRATCNATTPSEPPVIYARIDHVSKRHHNNPSMLAQAQTTVPLLISSSSGGVSPSSIMNTSCDSSGSGGSSSRCPRATMESIDPCGGRNSSSADEGFTSGSSPVNGTNNNMPIILSPQSSDTQDTAHLVSSSSSSTTSSHCNGHGLEQQRKPLVDCLARESTV